ncbi:MAG: hypothetical protein AAFU72_04965 [Pseudomonadota bacterium]
MICIDRFEGVDRFKGLGELDEGQMASLLDRRQPVSQSALALARAGWAAFRSEDPRDLVTFLDGDLEALPFLAPALKRHLKEYPSCTSGLTRTERQLLSLAASGVHDPGAMFLRNMALETTLYIGDWPTYTVIDALCTADLLACEPGPFRFPPGIAITAHEFREQRRHPTERGMRVLRRERYVFALWHRDFWLGGVHLRSDGPIWAWDAARSRLVRRDP